MAGTTRARHRAGGRRLQQPLPIRHRQGWDKWAAKAERAPHVPEAAPMPETPVTYPGAWRRVRSVLVAASPVCFFALVAVLSVMWGAR